MRVRASGFSMIELLIAMSITMGVGLIAFQLFLQNQNVFRDENLVLELQQSVRAVASMMADELRQAGQGTPTYSASQDTSTAEASQTFLNGTDAGSIVFRSGVRNAMAIPSSSTTYAVGSPTAILIDNASNINSIVGGDSGYFLYLWGQTTNSWTWVRAQITAIDTASNPNTITATPRQISGQGGTFSLTPNLVLEEAIEYRLSSDEIQRGTSGDFTTLTSPTMTYQTIGENFTRLSFTYYDEDDTAVTVMSLADRASIRRVDFTLAAQTAEVLPSTGERQTYAITMRIHPRNVRFY